MTASDLTPELLVGPRQYGDTLDITWNVDDAEALPYADGQFDTAISCVGIMVAPHHQLAADELVRVTRRDGTIAVLSWSPAGFIGQMFATMKPFAPTPPPGVQQPPLWGDELHVRVLLGDRVTDVTATTASLTVDRFGSAEEFRDFSRRRTGRRSRRTAPSPTSPRRSQPWTRPWPSSLDGTAPTRAHAVGVPARHRAQVLKK